MMTQTATNEAGEKVILVGDEWQKVEGSSTNAQGQKAYLVRGEWHGKFNEPSKDYEHPADPEPTAFSGRSFGYYADKAKRGVRGAASFPGLAVDALNQAAGAVPGTPQVLLDKLKAEGKIENAEQTFPQEHPFLGSGHARDRLTEGLDIKDQPAPPEASRFLGEAAELAAAGAGGGAAIIKAAPHKMTAIMAEIASTVMGSVGSVVGEEVGGETGRNVGSIFGSISGYNIPTLTTNSMSYILRKLSPEARQEAARLFAAGKLKPAIESYLGSQRNMEQADEITGAMRKFGRFDPTLGARTGAPAVQEIEETLVQRSVENLSRASERAGQNAATIETAKQGFFGSGKASNIIRDAQSRINNASRIIRDRLTQLGKSKRDIADLGGKEQLPTGRQLRDEYWKLRLEVKKDFDKAYGDLYDAADAAKLAIPVDDVRTTVVDIQKADPNAFQDMPGTFAKIKDVFKKSVKEGTEGLVLAMPDGTMHRIKPDEITTTTSFRKFHSLWKEVNREQQMLARSGNPKVHFAKQLKEALEGKLNQLEEAGMGEISAAFKDINARYGSEYGKVFKEGVGGTIGQINRFGASVDDSRVVEQFFTPDGMEDFARIYGTDKGANDMLSSGVVGMFQRRVVNEVTGEINPVAAETFLRQNKETLNKIPDVKAMLTGARAQTAALAEREARLALSQKQIDKSVLTDIAKAEDVPSLLEKSVKRPSYFARLISAAKTDAQKMSLVRSLADELPMLATRSHKEPIEFLMDNEKSFKPIISRLGKQHWDNLKTIAGAQTLHMRQAVPASVRLQLNKEGIQELTGSSPRALVSAYISVERGRTGPHQEIAQILSRYGIKMKEKVAEELMNEAIYDEKVASAIASLVKNPVEWQRNRLAFHALNAAFRVIMTEGEPQE